MEYFRLSKGAASERDCKVGLWGRISGSDSRRLMNEPSELDVDEFNVVEAACSRRR